MIIKNLAEILKRCISSGLLIYLCIVVFFFLQLFQILNPYFWDELGVYAPAALYLHDHGLSLLPGALPPELSRGHPLLCPAIFGFMYLILGPHVWVGHFTALIISCSLLVLLYHVGKEITNHNIAALACLMLIVQPVFIAQATLVLPEVLLALLSTCALFAYAKNRLGLFALFSSLAILTKETAIALPAAIACIELARAIITRKLWKNLLPRLLATVTPLWVWLLFLLLQWHSNGWLFFPLHSGYVSFSPQELIPRLGFYLSFLAKGQGRYIWTAVILFAMYSYIQHNRRDLLKTIKKNIVEALINRNIFLTGVVFVAVALLVLMLNFNMARYTLFILPSCCLLIALLFFSLVSRFRTIRYVAVLLVCLPFLYSSTKYFNFDADRGYLHIIRTHCLVSKYLNEHYPKSTVIKSSWPVSAWISDQRAGYLSFVYPNTEGQPCLVRKDSTAKIYIYTYPGNLEDCMPDEDHLTLVKEYTSSFAKALIYTPLK